MPGTTEQDKPCPVLPKQIIAAPISCCENSMTPAHPTLSHHLREEYGEAATHNTVLVAIDNYGFILRRDLGWYSGS